MLYYDLRDKKRGSELQNQIARENGASGVKK